MQSISFSQVVEWLMFGGLAVGVGAYLYAQYQASLMRTSIHSVPGGLCFTARDFSVEAQHGAKQLLITTQKGIYTSSPLAGGEEVTQLGPLTVTFAAVGLQIEVRQILQEQEKSDVTLATGYSRIVFQASDKLRQIAGENTPNERSSLVLNSVPDQIAVVFQQFSNGLAVWVAKIEKQLVADMLVQRQREEAAAQEEADAAAAAAALLVPPAPDDPLATFSAEVRAQITQWRSTAGFAGSLTDVGLDTQGKVAWFVDLDPTGQIILHGGKRSFHGSLKGAKVTLLKDDLEVSVRDDFWSVDNPQRAVFRVGKGLSMEKRIDWKAQLEAAIASTV